jgi:hypothetical protein
MRISKNIAGSLIAGALAILPAVGQASSYTDEGAWRSAVLGAYSLETFDTLAAF